jgi:hypothetical protein
MPRRPPSDLEATVLARDGTREGEEIRFRCPEPESHQNGDANPSARYHPGKHVWRCDVCGAGGGWKDLCERLNVSIPAPSRREPAAIYEYRSEVGELLRRKLRWEPGPKGRGKSFSWEKPDGAGGWQRCKGDGNPRILYRSEAIPAAREAGHPVLVVEGEKDADRAAALGLVAVTNPEGAGPRKWKSEYSEQLRGLAVVIVPDQDPTGQIHAFSVARGLAGVAQSIAILDLPGETVNDLSDWAGAEEKAGRSQDEIRARLETLIAEAPPWDPEADPGDDGAEAADTSSSDKEPTQSEILLGLVKTAGVELFHAPDREPFALVPVNCHRETWRVRSTDFRYWLLHGYYDLTGKAPNAQSLQDARNTLAAQALFAGDEHAVHTRVAESDGRIYLDLGNEAWEAVEVTESGWQLVAESPVRFRREPGMEELPRPVSGGSIAELRPFINLPDDDAFALFVAFLVAALRPRGPYPVLALHGEQGSAKSTLARIARALVDPAGAPLRSLPGSVRDLMISATHTWVLAFDNLSGIPAWLSDAFCRLSTGGGFSARELYTDSDEVIFSAMRPVILNGIDDVVGRQDLGDRSITLSLPRIEDGDRLREDEIWSEFERLRPRLLGALLDAVSCALSRQASVRLERSPRMADFAHWAVAAEPALPWEEGTFLAAYESNRRESIEVALEADLVGSAVRSLVAERGRFEGTCQELQALIDERESEAVRRSKSWPKSPRGLSSQLKRAAPALRQAGIDVEQGIREPGTGKRLVQITGKEDAGDRHDRHNGHASPPAGASVRDGCAGAVTVDASHRHTPDPENATVPAGRDGCDGSIPAHSDPLAGDDGEELRI